MEDSGSMKPSTEEEIIEVIENHADNLYRYAYYKVNNKEKAEDLVQSTYVSAIKNWDSFESRSSRGTWLNTILRNKIIDFYRKRGRQDTNIGEPTDVYMNLFNKSGKWKDPSPISKFSTYQERLLEKDEFYEHLEECLTDLSEKQKSAFRMRYLDELESDEICKLMDITSSNYWVLLHRAKLKLQNCLSSIGYP